MRCQILSLPNEKIFFFLNIFKPLEGKKGSFARFATLTKKNKKMLLPKKKPFGPSEEPKNLSVRREERSSCGQILFLKNKKQIGSIQLPKERCFLRTKTSFGDWCCQIIWVRPSDGGAQILFLRCCILILCCYRKKNPSVLRRSQRICPPKEGAFCVPTKKKIHTDFYNQSGGQPSEKFSIK